MKLRIDHQESYSRLELILRSFFGWIYIMIPHAFLLAIFGIAAMVLIFISFFAVLFTGTYPKNFFDFQIKYLRWRNRVGARLYNLSDGYPSFGLDGEDELTDFDVEYPEKLSRGLLLLRFFLGYFYIIIPHGFCLMFRSLATMVLAFLAWWVVLFTGKYPKSWHEFNVGTFRWSFRLVLYLYFMTDKYPPFSGKPDEVASSNGDQVLDKDV